LIAAGLTISPRLKSELFGLNLNLAWGMVLAASGAFFVLTARKKK
jgi:hypothetical protein